MNPLLIHWLTILVKLVVAYYVLGLLFSLGVMLLVFFGFIAVVIFGGRK